MHKAYVEWRDDDFYLVDSRIPLATIAWEFQQGVPPEGIVAHYSTLSLEQVYGSIAFYLAHREEADKDIEERRRTEDEFVESDPIAEELRERLQREMKRRGKVQAEQAH